MKVQKFKKFLKDIKSVLSEKEVAIAFGKMAIDMVLLLSITIWNFFRIWNMTVKQIFFDPISWIVGIFIVLFHSFFLWWIRRGGWFK